MSIRNIQRKQTNAPIKKEQKKVAQAISVEETRLEKLKSGNKEKESKIIKIKKELKDLEIKIEKNDNNLRCSQKEIKSADKRLKIVEEIIDKTRDEMVDLEVEYDDKKESIKNDEIQLLADISKKKEEKENEIFILKTERDKIKKGSDEVLKIGENASQILANKKKIIEELEVEIKEKCERLAKIKEEIEKFGPIRDELQDIKKEKKELANRILQERESVKEELRKLAGIKKEREDKLADLIERENNLDNLKQSIEKRELQFAIRKKKVEELAQTLQKHFDKLKMPIKIWPESEQAI